MRYQRTNLQVHIATRLPKILFVSDEVWPGLVRPPGFEFPDHRLMVSRVVGLEAQWTLQAMSYTRLDYGRTDPRVYPWVHLSYDSKRNDS